MLAKKSLIALLLCLLAYQSSQAAIRATVDKWLSQLGGKDHFDASKRIDWGVLPGPFYTPELGVGLGVAVVGLYRPDAQDKQSQNSTITLSGFTSSTGSFGFTFDNHTFLANDQWRIIANGAIDNVPTDYWGIGYDAGKAKHQRLKYIEKEFSFSPQVLYRLWPNSYLGFGWDMSTINASHLKEGDPQLLTDAEGGLSTFNSGISSILSYDSRDFVANAQQGQWAQIKYTYFTPAMASDSRFSATELNYDYYHALNEASVLAFDLYSRLTEGNVPWNQLSLLGDSQRMRGYYQGRYRDRNVLSGQIEYRQHLSWRHGYVLWMGAGTLSHNVSQLGRQHWLPTAGVGYRFEFKPRMNVRLDYGIGRQTSGFYFQVGEAF